MSAAADIRAILTTHLGAAKSSDELDAITAELMQVYRAGVFDAAEHVWRWAMPLYPDFPQVVAINVAALITDGPKEPGSVALSRAAT